MSKRAKAPATATGYKPTPPFVAAIESPPAINPIKIPPIGTSKPLTAGIVAQNMATYMIQIKIVWKINAHFFFIVKMLKTPSFNPKKKSFNFKANFDFPFLI